MTGSAGQVFDEIRQEEKGFHPPRPTKQIQNPSNSTLSLSLNHRHLIALAVMVAFAGAGMVRSKDIAFVIFIAFYVVFLSKFAFPQPGTSPDPPLFGQNNRLLANYVLFAAIVGLILPFAHIVEGIFQGDKSGVDSSVPHLFLLSSQVFMEGVVFRPAFSLPVRAFVPISYNTRRIFTIFDWLRCEVGRLGGDASERRVKVGLGLAIANLLLWCYNLFGFLLPVYLPLVFKRYPLNKVKN